MRSGRLEAIARGYHEELRPTYQAILAARGAPARRRAARGLRRAERELQERSTELGLGACGPLAKS